MPGIILLFIARKIMINYKFHFYFYFDYEIKNLISNPIMHETIDEEFDFGLCEYKHFYNYISKKIKIDIQQKYGN